MDKCFYKSLYRNFKISKFSKLKMRVFHNNSGGKGKIWERKQKQLLSCRVATRVCNMVCISVINTQTLQITLVVIYSSGEKLRQKTRIPPSGDYFNHNHHSREILHLDFPDHSNFYRFCFTTKQCGSIRPKPDGQINRKPKGPKWP